MIEQLSLHRIFLLGIFSLTILSFTEAQISKDNCTRFVSIENGRGRDGSFEKPSKDIANLKELKMNEVVCVAGGTYLGRGKNGSTRFDFPVSIIGGWSQDFTTRDPWGAHKTILTGIHNSDNFVTDYTLTINTSKYATKLKEARGEPTAHSIVIDGLILDNGSRNYYNESESRIIRKGNATHTPTPESGGLNITTGINSKITVRNVLVMNTAPTVGAFSLKPGRSAEVTITNNIAINNTGVGFHLGSSYAGSTESDYPKFNFQNNISLFNEKHDPIATYGGSSVMLQSSTNVIMTNNVLGFNDYYAVDNTRRAKDVVMTENLIINNAVADYVEFDTKMSLEDIEDWSDYMDDASDNVSTMIKLNLSKEWITNYVARDIIDRNAAEEEVKAVKSWMNDVRSFWGANVQGTDLNVDSNVWLPRMSLEDALSVAGMYSSLYGTYNAK